MEILQSPQNKLVKRLISYNQKKVRDADNVFIAEGLRFVEEIPADWDVVCYGFREDFVQNSFFETVFQKAPCYIFSQKIFSLISQTKSPQGVFAVCRQKNWTLQELISKKELKKELKKEASFLILAEELNDPGNLGTIIRTADAASIDGVILSKGSVDLYNPKVLRATMGSLFHVPVVENAEMKQAITLLKEKGILILGAHLKGNAFPYDIDMKRPIAIFIGNEAKGLSASAADSCDRLVKIPMLGQAESLNASMAAGILIYEGVRQRISL